MPTEEMVDDKLPDNEVVGEFDDDEAELGDDAIDAEVRDIDDDESAPAVDKDDDDADDEADDDTKADDDTEAEALDELEAEELDMLTDDESSETLVVDEAAEMRQIRREELAMDRTGADEATEDEFVCTPCVRVLKTRQLADGRRKLCRDCAA